MDSCFRNRSVVFIHLSFEKLQNKSLLYLRLGWPQHKNILIKEIMLVFWTGPNSKEGRENKASHFILLSSITTLRAQTQIFQDTVCVSFQQHLEAPGSSFIMFTAPVYLSKTMFTFGQIAYGALIITCTSF